MSGAVSLLSGIALRAAHHWPNQFRSLVALGDVPDWIFAVLGVCGLVVAGYRAWNDERQRAIMSEREIDRLSKPSFIVESDARMSGHVGGVTLCFLSVRVTNNGSDSAVIEWQVHYDSPTLSHTKLRTVFARSGAFSLMLPTGGEYAISNEELVYSKTGVIPRGGFIAGRMPVEIPGDRCEELKSTGTKITIGVKDYLGRWHYGYHVGSNLNQGEIGMMQGETLLPQHTGIIKKPW